MKYIMNGKDITAVEKIIKRLAYRDYRAANPLKADGRPKYKRHHPYTLGVDTNEAREIKWGYVHGEITEEQYKAWCLRYNLTHLED